MDTVSSLVTPIHHQTLPTPSKSTITLPPDIANALTGNLPPPPFANSLNQLRGFSTALSEFLGRFDELQNHVNLSIDSKSPGHIVDTITTTNPNLSALTNLSFTSCNQSIDASPEIVASGQSPNDYRRRNGSAKATEKSDSTPCLLNSDGIDTFIDALTPPASTAPVTRRKRRLKELYASSSVDTNTKQIHNIKYRGVRMRKSGKWVAEMRMPKGRKRIWLGTYSSAVAAARAYDTAVFYLYGPTKHFNFPNLFEEDDGHLCDLSTDSVRKKAMEVGAKVDALKSQKGGALANSEDFDACMEDVVIDIPKKLEVTDTGKKPKQIGTEEIEILKKTEQTIILNEPKEIDILKEAEQTDDCKNPVEIYSLENLEETKTAYKPKEIDILKKAEQTDDCKNPVEIYSLENLEETETAKKHEETGISKKAGETETDVSRKPVETGIVSVLECLCRNMYGRLVRRHVTTYLYEMNKLHKEIANALKLAVDPAKLVLDSIGTLFLESWRSFWEDSHLTLARLASVLILECFVMISSDGIEISKTQKEYAEQAATDWRNRMIKDGGLRQTDEIDARGLLLFISGFGIQDGVFKVQDIADLIRASNVKEISDALCGSVFLIPKVPEVIDFMVKNNLEIEAADIAYTFGLKDVSQNILRTYLHNLVKDIQNCSSLQTLEAMKQHLCDLKSLKQFLESHKVDPSLLLPDFKMTETIQNLERETNKGILTQNRELLENLIHLDPNDKSMKKPVGYAETDSSNKSEATVAETFCAQTVTAVPEAIVCMQKPVGHAEPDFSIKSEAAVAESSCAQTIIGVPEAVCMQKPVGPAETDSSKKSEAAVAETTCAQTIIAVPEAVVCMQKTVGRAEIDSSSKSEATVAETSCAQTIISVPEAVCMRKPVGHAETDSSKKSEAPLAETSCAQTIITVPEAVACMQKTVGLAENDSSTKSEKPVADASCAQTITAVPEAVVLKQDPCRMTTNHKQAHEKVDVVDVSKKPNTLKKPEETETDYLKEPIISVLESLCQNMSFKKLKTHVTTHFSEMNNRRKEIVKALKLAADPAKLVLYSIGTFFVQSSRTFCEDAYQSVERLALVLILECFVMASSDGIEIANTEKEYAAENAADWRNRMTREGGLGHTDEVDARGLLLFISGFGIQDDVFMIQDIMDLIRATNVKGISTALRGSVFLIAKLPDVINLMVENNLQTEAVDIVYTFGLEDKCCPPNLLRTYMNNLVKDIQNDSLQTLETRKQQLLNLKSVKQCLEFHNVDPSILLPDFKVNEMIEYLVREVNVERMTLKRKSLESPAHEEAKRACFNHENIPPQPKSNVGHHGTIPYNQSTQPSTHYLNNAEKIVGSVPIGPSYGLPGSYAQSVQRAEVPPYGWHGPNGQTYVSQPQSRPCVQVPPEPFSYVPPSGGFPGRWGLQQPFPGYMVVPPSGGFPGWQYPPEPYNGVKNYPPSGGFPRRQGPSEDLYSFIDKV